MLDSLTVDQPTLARIFGVSTRTVQRYGPEGLDETRVGGGATYDLPAAVAWLVARDAERNAPLSPDEYTVARTRKEQALARLRELEVGQREGDLLDAGDVEIGQRDIAHHVKSTFLAWPGRVAAEIAADLGVEAGKVGVVLESQMRRFLTELSESFTEAVDHAA